MFAPADMPKDGDNQLGRSASYVYHDEPGKVEFSSFSDTPKLKVSGTRYLMI